MPTTLTVRTDISPSTLLYLRYLRYKAGCVNLAGQRLSYREWISLPSSRGFSTHV